MSVKQSVNWLSQQRVDIPDLKALDSSVIFDFKTLIQAFAGNNPYILQGFTIPVSGIGGPATSLQMVVDSAYVWIPGDINGSFLRVQSGQANDVLNSANPNVVGSFSAGVNYIGIQFNRATDPSTADLVNFWDVDSQSEFSKTVPRGLVMNYQIVISNTGFGNTCPVAVVQVSGSNVTSILNSKFSPWRLGQGGPNPNVNYSHTYAVNPENNVLATSNGSPDPFAGGDWELKTFKDWADAVMTEIKNIKNSAFWYSNGSSLIPGVNLSDLYFDTAASLITGGGRFKHDPTTAGLLTWTSNINIRSIMGPLTFVVSAGNVTLADKQSAYITLVRNQDFQSANTFTFTNGTNSIVGTLTVSGISPGDWIKFFADDITKWAQVSTVVGNTVTLTSNYLGSSGVGKALRSQGTYTMSTGSPTTVPANSNVFWFARRDDNSVPTATIASPGSSGLTRTSEESTVTTTNPHSLVEGQAVTIAGASDATFDGVFEIDSIPSSTSFTIYNPGSNVPGGTAGNGTVSVNAKIYLRALGELSQGEEKQIDDTAWVNILKFVGMRSETDTTPQYTIVPNMLSPFQFDSSYNLTLAISQITGNVNSIFTTLAQPSYDESYDIVSGAPGAGQLSGPISASTTITIPVNSRLPGSPQQFYIVGNGTLEVYINGVYLRQGAPFGWHEVGSTGSSSSQIVTDRILNVQDTITFRLDATGGPGSGASGISGGTNTGPSGIGIFTGVVSTVMQFAKIKDTASVTWVNNGDGTISANSTGGGGGGPRNVNTYTANHTASISTDGLILVDASSGPVTITLPTVSIKGIEFDIKKIDATSNAVTINGNGNNIDGASSLIISSQYVDYTICGDTAAWWIL